MIIKKIAWSAGLVLLLARITLAANQRAPDLERDSNSELISRCLKTTALTPLNPSGKIGPRRQFLGVGQNVLAL